MSTPFFRDEYLGDGVYVSFDGYHFALDLRAQSPAPDSRIALEPEVLGAFVVFVRTALAQVLSDNSLPSKENARKYCATVARQLDSGRRELEALLGEEGGPDGE